jgi:hypothetical protein
MKYRLTLLCFVVIALLGLRDPGKTRRDPVPEELIVAHSVHCVGCHGYDPTGVALTDADGNDVNIYDDWQVSMMALASKDPFWRATLNLEVSLFPDAKAAIELACLKCHAPLGSQQRKYDGLEYSYADLLTDSLGLDGVSCAACHQHPPETYGRSHSGNITMNTERLLYGPHPEPLNGPMELYVGFTPVYTDLIYSSGVCAGCHTLITETLDGTGQPTGDLFVEQATYHEWINSTYAFQGVECQNCHLPVIQDSVILAIDLKDLDKRSPFGVHQFYGANTAMLILMKENRKALGLPDTISDAAWDESILNNRMSLRSAAELRLESYSVASDTLYVYVTVVNKSGHKLPTGYPSRLAWLQVSLTDDLTGDPIYMNGMMDQTGNIIGRDIPYEPHHQISYSEDDVQIYEMAMSDVAGNITTRLNAARQPKKDNRLLPKGFRATHAVYDTVAVWGAALEDADYTISATAGVDRIEYRIPLNGRDGLADLDIVMRYHTFPARWMHDLFEHDGIAEVSTFKEMYAGYETFTELIDSLRVEDLILDVSGVEDVSGNAIRVFPNPVVSRSMHVISDVMEFDAYELVNVDGREVQCGTFTDQILLNSDIVPGAYFILLKSEGKVSAVRKIIVY